MAIFKLSDKAKDYLIQVILIVGSVLLALWLDQLMADHKQNTRKDAAINNIITEVSKNQEEVKSVYEYHFTVSERISGFIDSVDFRNESKNALEIISPFIRNYGLQIAQLQNTAWNMATDTEVVSLFDYEMAYDMTYLYDLQTRGVESTTEKIMNFLTESSLFRTEDNEEIVKVITYAMNELARQEQFLVEKYGEFLEKYQK